MKYLVTGGTGNLGSRVVRDLIREGEQVIIYDLVPAMNLLEHLLEQEELKQIKMVPGDVTDFPFLLRTVKDNQVEKVIHLASLLTNATNINPLMGIKVNVEGTVNVFETARFLGLKKVVWASSNSVFGPPEMYSQKILSNDAPHYPQGIYGASKSLCEVIATYYCEQYGMDITGLRYALIFGTGQASSGAAGMLQELLYNPAIGKPGRVSAPDNFGFIYVDDAARLTVLASKAVKPKTKAFSIDGEVHSIQEVADFIKGLIPSADIVILPTNAAAPGASGIPWKAESWRHETRLVEEELGYRPQCTFELAIKEQLNIVRRQYGLPNV